MRREFDSLCDKLTFYTQLVLVQKQTVGMVTWTVTMVTCWCVFRSFIVAHWQTDTLVMVRFCCANDFIDANNLAVLQIWYVF